MRLFKREGYLQSERSTPLRSLCLDLAIVTELLLYQQDICEETETRLFARQRAHLAQLVALEIQPNIHVGNFAPLSTDPVYYAEYLAGQLLGAIDGSGAWQGVLTRVEVGFVCLSDEKVFFEKRLICQQEV